MVGGGINRVANAADRQSVGVRVDARARRPPQCAPVALAALSLVSSSTLLSGASENARHQRE
jgi:hypothetical protein